MATEIGTIYLGLGLAKSSPFHLDLNPGDGQWRLCVVATRSRTQVQGWAGACPGLGFPGKRLRFLLSGDSPSAGQHDGSASLLGVRVA